MGESAAETVREIEDTRERLDRELRELEERLPKPAVLGKRLAGVAVGGGVGGAALIFALKRARKKRKAAKAAKLATQVVPVQTVVSLLPAQWGERLAKAFDDEGVRGWLLLIGGAWIVFRLAEVRQLRRMNRALIASRV